MNSSGLLRVFLGANWKEKGIVQRAAAVPRWCSAAAAAAAAASRCALSSLAASWAPKAPDRASRPDPLLSARLGWGSPDGCGPTGKPWACWERCWAWSCCCKEKNKETEKETEERKRDLGDLWAQAYFTGTHQQEERMKKRKGTNCCDVHERSKVKVQGVAL